MKRTFKPILLAISLFFALAASISFGADGVVFNRNFAGLDTSRNQAIPQITLPSEYEFGDNYITQDLRLSRTFVFKEKFRFTLVGEVFNVLNIANLSGHSGNLANSATFGQPTRRVDQAFGSGGPRAFQFGARVSF
jgi:hypothetical protein